MPEATESSAGGADLLGPLEPAFAEMARRGASDLFCRAGKPPVFRVNGAIERSDLPAVAAEQVKAFFDRVLSPVARQRFEQSPDADVSIELGQMGRFRLSLFYQQGCPGLVARHVPAGQVKFEDLGLPPIIRRMANHQAGLLLVVGPTGCGKSTTLAALVGHINHTRSGHVVTIEDPIEFVHHEDRCLIDQRQVGYDTVDFPTALRHVVRQSPDVILIGEMRDRDTITTATAAALTGHLILSTLHTTNVVQSIDRILNYFPPEARRQVQADLAATLIGVVSMRLLPRKDSRGRVPALEILTATPRVRKLIGEGRLAEVHDAMKRGTADGMCTLNQYLVGLCAKGLVDEDLAVQYAPNPEEFRLNRQGMFTGIDSVELHGGAGEIGSEEIDLGEDAL